MKILALNWNDLKNPYSGGAEVQLEELLVRLVDYGHEVTLFCSGFKGCLDEEMINGYRVIRRGNRYNFNFIAPYHLRKLVRKNKYDVLVEDINKIPFYTPLFFDIKTLVMIPHLFASTVFHEVNFILASYVYFAEKPLVTFYKGKPFSVVSESTADDMKSRGVPEKDITIIHNGVDRKLYAYDATVKKYDRPSILYLGRIKKYKSIQHLIDAFALVKEKIPDATLTIVGDGDYAGVLKKQAASSKYASDIVFTGFIPAKEKVERLRKSHVAVLPSLKEGWGLTNIEANSVGTTVVAANTPGLKDSVRHNQTGLLYEYGNINEMSEKLISILGDSELRGRLERGGLEWADKFSWDNYGKETEKLLYEITGEK